jgi:hypothetical protein
VGSVLTAEVTAADGADDNDVDGDTKGDDSMVGQWERTKAEEVEQARTEGLGEASTCSCSSVPGWSLL